MNYKVAGIEYPWAQPWAKGQSPKGLFKVQGTGKFHFSLPVQIKGIFWKAGLLLTSLRRAEKPQKGWKYKNVEASVPWLLSDWHLFVNKFWLFLDVYARRGRKFRDRCFARKRKICEHVNTSVSSFGKCFSPRGQTISPKWDPIYV